MTFIHEWLKRARVFVDRLRHLPGGIYVKTYDEPRTKVAVLDRVVQELGVPLPGSLKDLYLEGHATCEYRYGWEPPASLVRKLAAILPDESEIGGGPHFVHYRELKKTLQLTKIWASDVIESWDEPDAERAASVWRHSLPFISIDNGDYLAFDLQEESDNPPIVYLCHDASDGTTIVANSFIEFLTTWESVCYIGPENWLLDHFVDEQTQLFAVQGDRATRLRQLIEDSLTN